MLERVGIRELRQNLSRYIDRVRRGEKLVVTERGKPVATLAPWADGLSGYEQLIAEGRIVPAKGNLKDLRLPGGPIRDDVMRVLDELREDKI